MQASASAEADQVLAAESENNQTVTPNGKERTRVEPQEPLPTDRVAFEKQLKFLLAYAAASDNAQKAVSNEDVAKLVDMNSSTVSLANNFFVKIGFLTRTGREFQPSREVLDYKLANEWDVELAPTKLAPLIERSWFCQELKPKLQMRAIEEGEAISALAQRAMVTPDYRPQLRMLINYLTVSGLVRREGDRLTWVRQSKEPPSHERPSAPPPKTDSPIQQPSPAPRGTGPGSINFSVNISVDMAEMGTWPAERIQAFFAGLAAVLSAKAGEK